MINPLDNKYTKYPWFHIPVGSLVKVMKRDKNYGKVGEIIWLSGKFYKVKYKGSNEAMVEIEGVQTRYWAKDLLLVKMYGDQE